MMVEPEVRQSGRRGTHGSREPSETMKLGRSRQSGEMTMQNYYEGLPAAANVEQSIVRAQLQIVKDLERRKQSAAAVQLLIDSVTRLAA